MTQEEREYWEETVWLVAEAFGADRSCDGCRKVVRKLSKREAGWRCALHWSPSGHGGEAGRLDDGRGDAPSRGGVAEAKGEEG